MIYFGSIYIDFDFNGEYLIFPTSHNLLMAGSSYIYIYIYIFTINVKSFVVRLNSLYIFTILGAAGL